jgi:hypothetical protein
MIDNDRWYESLGENINKLAQAYITAEEKGKVFERIYLNIVREAERDAREQRNKEQYHE